MPLPARRSPLPAAALYALALAMAAPSTARAADTPPAGPAGRYAMYPADNNGFLRLDTQTGEMSLCTKKGAAWACDSLPDERASLKKENDALAARNKDLETSVKRLEDLAGIGEGDRPDRRADKGPGITLPTEKDVDQAVDYVQRMYRKFKDKIREFEGTERKGTIL